MNPGLEYVPRDRLTFTPIGSTLFTKPDELRRVGQYQILRVKAEWEDHRHGLTSSGDQECLTSLSPLHDVGGVGLKIANAH